MEIKRDFAPEGNEQRAVAGRLDLHPEIVALEPESAARAVNFGLEQFLDSVPQPR
jgi:hypothetical protein